MRRPLILLVLLLGTASAGFAQVSETITFLEEDGIGHTTFTSFRSPYALYRLYYDRDLSLDEVLKEYLYVFPNEYRYDTESDPERNMLVFPQGSYGLLTKGDLSASVEVSDDGVYTYRNWDGETVYADGHYGAYNTPNNFVQYARAWVLPDNLELLHYECNRAGEWVRRENTIAYFGRDVNDLVFTLEYRPRTAGVSEALNTALGRMEGVTLEQEAAGVRVVLAETILFPSGSAALSEAGQALLAKVAGALAHNGLSVVVEGHTDNVPIQGRLAATYPTNWELSAARALTVVRALLDGGVAPARLEARAYADTRPRASNAQEAGRAQNRRIELLLRQTP